LRGRLRNLEREAAVSLVVVEYGDSKTSGFREDEVFSRIASYTRRSGARGTSPEGTLARHIRSS
jgi:hypothetical protein